MAVKQTHIGQANPLKMTNLSTKILFVSSVVIVLLEYIYMLFIVLHKYWSTSFTCLDIMQTCSDDTIPHLNIQISAHITGEMLY